MKRIVAVNADDLDCVVEAGVTRNELNAHLRDSGLFFPIDPGADASLGGMAATRASGTNAVRYGTMKDNVLALTVVLPDGSVARTGGRARKSSAGYDLTRLIVGSEGTLAVITEITLRLAGLPEATSGGVSANSQSLDGACATVIATIQAGIPIARIELMDEVQVRACNAYSRLGLPETPLLFVEFHGSVAGVEEQSRRFGEIAGEFGCTGFEWATRPEDRSRLWKARHDAYFAARALRPTAKGISTDVCVPISRLAACIAETKADIAATGLIAPIVGHVGDGNFHVLPLIDFGDPAEVARGTAFVDRLVRRALAFGGTSHRRARHRAIEPEVHGPRVRRAGARDDARDQTSARPGRHHEPGQGDSGPVVPVRGPARRLCNPPAPLMVVSRAMRGRTPYRVGAGSHHEARGSPRVPSERGPRATNERAAASTLIR